MSLQRKRGKIRRRGFETVSKAEFARKRGVTEIAHVSGLTHFSVRFTASSAGQIAVQRVEVLEALSEENITAFLVKFHPQALHFCVPSDRSAIAERVLIERLRLEPNLTHHCSMVSVISSAMRGLPGVMSRIAETICALSIDVLETSDTRSAVVLLVRETDATSLVDALCEVFDVSVPK